MRKIDYVSLCTGWVTTDHREAVEWFRNGEDVAVRLNGERVTTWEH